jgi:hypothetical protein
LAEIRKRQATLAWRRAVATLAVAAILASLLADCTTIASQRHEEREARANVYPDNYRSDLLAALHAYVIDPTNMRDAYLSDPAIRQIGAQNRYTACVRYNSKNGDGRYVGSRDAMAMFVNGRFDRFVDQALLPGETSLSGAALQAKEACDKAEYKPFPELQTLRR